MFPMRSDLLEKPQNWTYIIQKSKLEYSKHNAYLSQIHADTFVKFHSRNVATLKINGSPITKTGPNNDHEAKHFYFYFNF